MLSLRGAAALSAFRLEKLAQKASQIHPDIRLLHCEFVHFVEDIEPLSAASHTVLTNLLAHGSTGMDNSEDARRDVTLLLVVPRPGTISPWSSKATDIAHNCGLLQIERIERGIAWYVQLPAGLVDASVTRCKHSSTIA